jgi:hypothetical protein
VIRGSILACLVLFLAPTSAAHAAAATPVKRVVIALLPTDPHPPKDLTIPQPTILERLDRYPQLALGLSGATQSSYSQVQALLDITQGTRVSKAAYHPKDPPVLVFYPTSRRTALFEGWLDATARADSAPADIYPGLLAASVPGGAGYAGVTGRAQLEAVLAADRAGRVRLVSIGPAREIVRRTRSLLARRRLVVAGLPTGDRGEQALADLIAARRPGELLIATQTPPRARAPKLLALGILGLGEPGALTSSTTRLGGVVAGIDILPTVLMWLDVPVPKAVKGQPIRIDGKRDAEALMELSDRLEVVAGRRFPALETLLAAWLGVLLLFAVVADRRGTRAAMRLGALALLWVLPVLLVTAALAPTRTAEMVILGGGTFLLAALTDRLVPWPRGPVVPCLVTIVMYVIDLARGSDLIIRSLLGPNPRFGSRYYGIGNELEATLPVLLFMGVGILLARRGRSREGALAFAVAGLGLGVAVGAGRLGADVGGVITIGAGTAVAVLFMLPGGVTRRALVLAVLTPAAALAALAVIDLATGGNGHFTRTVLRAEGKDALTDIAARRYELAFNVLKRGLMPFATAIALLAVIYGLRYRDRLYAPLRAHGYEAWTAAFAGGLGSSIAGSLFNDSGPMLLVFGGFVLALVTVYVRGDPALGHAAPEASHIARRPDGDVPR